MIRRPPRSTLDRSSAASDVYKRQVLSAFAQTLGLSAGSLARLVPWRAVSTALLGGAGLYLVLTWLPHVTLLTLAALAAGYALLYAGPVSYTHLTLPTSDLG